MSLHRLVESFSIACVKCREPTELLALSEAVVRELGFDRLALVHGLWFRRSSPNLIRLDNFGEYANIFIERRYYRSEEHTSELQSLMRISYAVFCLKKKNHIYI